MKNYIFFALKVGFWSHLVLPVIYYRTICIRCICLTKHIAFCFELTQALTHVSMMMRVGAKAKSTEQNLTRGPARVATGDQSNPGSLACQGFLGDALNNVRFTTIWNRFW